MAVELLQKQQGKILEVRVNGKLTAEDYKTLTPRVETSIKQHGKVGMLFDMHDFHGWTACALWQDSKFAWKHFRDIERLAVVGEKAWQQGMATFCKPFTAAEVRYFDRSEADKALPWLEGGKAAPVPVQLASQDSFPASDPPSWTP